MALFNKKLFSHQCTIHKMSHLSNLRVMPNSFSKEFYIRHRFESYDCFQQIEHRKELVGALFKYLLWGLSAAVWFTLRVGWRWVCWCMKGSACSLGWTTFRFRTPGRIGSSRSPWARATFSRSLSLGACPGGKWHKFRKKSCIGLSFSRRRKTKTQDLKETSKTEVLQMPSAIK